MSEGSDAVYECPICRMETPMEQAMRPVGRQMFLRCAHCGQELHDAMVARMKLLDESRGKKD